MMTRFTEQAQEALQRAQQIMFARQHKHLDVEHLFLALLQQRNSLPVEIISRLGGDAQMMTRRLESALDSMQSFAHGSGVTPGYITLRANRVLQGAVEEADRLNDSLVSTEHLFLAIAAGPGGVAGRLLEEAEINDDNARATLLQIRGNPQAPTAGVTRHDIIQPQALVQPTGFSHGILTYGGRLLFLAGQTATDPEGKIVAPGDVVGQYRQVLSNLKAVVEEAGGTMTDIVKMTIFVRDRDGYKAHLKELGQAHREAFGTYYPATALLEISRFYDDEALVEIEGIAVLGGGGRWWGA
jgi:enamine deaminase RidA (YjgF/YER057c/UK114 family)